MRKFFLLIAGIMILISQPAAACIFVDSFPACENQNEIKQELKISGLDEDYVPACSKPLSYPYEKGSAEIFTVQYGRYATDHCGGYLTVEMLRLPDETYHVFHSEFFEIRKLNQYLETKLNTPFSFFNSYPYIGAKDYVDVSAYKKNGVLCIGYNLKYPFQGLVERCNEGDITHLPDFKGEVNYVENVLTWDQAMAKFGPECERHAGLENLNCKHMGRELQLEDWDNNDPTLMFLKNGQLDFYLFINGSFDVHDPKNRPGKIAVKVFANGDMQSKPILPTSVGNYTYHKDVLKVADEDFSKTTPKSK